MKYQFCIRFEKISANSAASKAVVDCNSIFLKHGYRDYTFTVSDNSNKLRYYFRLSKELISFFFAIRKGSVVGIQYPLLSINNVFRYFIKIARLKKIRFFCIVHDLESLRTGGVDKKAIDKEIYNLNQFDQIIVHNELMLRWLTSQGLKTSATVLGVFDYLSAHLPAPVKSSIQEIVYAGNLSKSKFIYQLSTIGGWRFNIYGPNYEKTATQQPNVQWKGEYSPEEIVEKLEGSFGLIWDGVSINECDAILGNYLKYNNPHKFSLYVAAGLPVIAPADSAIGVYISKNKLGLLVNNLAELSTIQVAEDTYTEMKQNVIRLRKELIDGHFFSRAIETVEAKLSNQQQ
jgi:hypothetical protein